MYFVDSGKIKKEIEKKMYLKRSVQVMIQISSDILTMTSEAVILAQAGRVEFANSAAREILGADCEGKMLKDLFEPDIANSQVSSFIADTTVKGMRCMVRVSKQKNMQAMFITRGDAETVEVNDAFIYALRSSLMMQSMSLELTRVRAEEQGDEEMLENVAALTQSYYRLTRLVSNISIAREMVSGGISFTPTELDLVSLCRACVENVQFYCHEPSVSFTAMPSMPITADGTLVTQLLLNLISNSLIHGKDCTRVSVSLIDAGESVIISVFDDGCGIEGDELYTVFTRYKHEFNMAGLGGGAGLGLTVARGIAEKHSGTLLLESRLDRGTTVRVSLKKKLPVQKLMRSDEKDYEADTDDVLVALSDYLPKSCYRNGCAEQVKNLHRVGK